MSVPIIRYLSKRRKARISGLVRSFLGKPMFLDPIRKAVDYEAISRKIFTVEEIPSGTAPFQYMSRHEWPPILRFLRKYRVLDICPSIRIEELKDANI